MKCNNCGHCCDDPLTQVNLTIGDIHRLTEFLGCSVEDLFKEHMAMNPFGDPDLIHYDLDLGLNKGCKFRMDGKCSVYSARPLNCRLFPYWLLAEAPADKLKDLFSENGFDYDLTKKKQYKAYKDALAVVLLEEAEWLKIDKKVNVTRLKGFDEINEENFRTREIKKIELIKKWNKEKPDIPLIKKLINEHLIQINVNTQKINKAADIVR